MNFMTIEHKRRYNDLLESLRYVSNKVQTLDEIKLYCSKRELDYQEYLEMRLMEVKKIADEAIKNKKCLPLTL